MLDMMIDGRYYVCFPHDGTDEYRQSGMCEYDTLSDALACIGDDINDLMIDCVVRLYYNGDIIGQFRGRAIPGDYNGQFDDWNDIEPAL